MSAHREIRLIEAEDGWWSAVDEETGVASQGETRSEALENLDEAVALHERDVEEPLSDDELRDLGLDPDDAPEEVSVPDAPWFENADS